MNSTAKLAFVLIPIITCIAVLFGIWFSVLEERIQNLADQQEEWWQRHMESHPKA